MALELIPANVVLPMNMSFYATANEDGSFALTLLGGSKPKASDNSRMLELCQKSNAATTSKDVKVSVAIDLQGSLTAVATFVQYDEDGTESNVGTALTGTCTLSANKQSTLLNDTDVLIMALRDGVGEYDSAMVVCASQEEVEDLEEEDAAKIMVRAL